MADRASVVPKAEFYESNYADFSLRDWLEYGKQSLSYKLHYIVLHFYI